MEIKKCENNVKNQLNRLYKYNKIKVSMKTTVMKNKRIKYQIILYLK